MSKEEYKSARKTIGRGPTTVGMKKGVYDQWTFGADTCMGILYELLLCFDLPFPDKRRNSRFTHSRTTGMNGVNGFGVR